MAIFVDLSQVVMSGVIVNLHKELSKPNSDVGDLIRHMVFSTLLSFKTKFGKEYGEMILCADSKRYWRRDYFPWYKGHRKHDREKSAIDWNTVFSAINDIKTELKDNFPYKMIEVDGAEADDVIACLTKHLQSNELTGSSLFGGEPQNILIVSSDGDYVQLQKYKNVSQWNPQLKKWVKGGNVHEFIIEHICGGDTGDGIPNILTSDEWAKARAMNEDKVRQTPFKKARFEEFYENGIDACKTDEERRNYTRNKTLVDFDEIPKDLYDSIVDTYTTYKVNGSKGKLMNYLSDF